MKFPPPCLFFLHRWAFYLTPREQGLVRVDFCLHCGKEREVMYGHAHSDPIHTPLENNS